MSKSMDLFGKRIEHFLVEKQWSEYDLADAAGINRPQITNLANGKGNPTLLTMEKIAEALGHPVADFFTESITISEKSAPPSDHVNNTNGTLKVTSKNTPYKPKKKA